jgi:hypothetical protein
MTIVQIIDHFQTISCYMSMLLIEIISLAKDKASTHANASKLAGSVNPSITLADAPTEGLFTV